ncbi:MAG: hypothetical protein KDD94_07920, partial [Calditrichaeota bacterium]|nr:hypothetical protein [Calditrichota bacterium]
NMKTGEFWNINLPRISAVQIKGIKIAPPSRSLYRFSFKQVWEETETDGDSEEVWLETGKRIFEPQNGSDIDLYRQNYIIITPMQLGEFNGQNLERLQKQLGDLPEIK